MVLQIQNTQCILIKIKKFCVIKVGNIVSAIIDIILLGRGKDIAGWIAIKVFNKQSCGCLERQIYLNELFGCPDGIKL
jgi:hypothetical protein